MSTRETASAKGRDLPGSLLFGGLLVFLLLLPVHLVIKRMVGDPFGTYWKEGLLGLLVILWAVTAALERRLPLTRTPLDWAVLAYAGLLLLRFLLDGASWAGAWGLYVSILYLPLFWLVPRALRDRPRRLNLLLSLLAGAGALVALGGCLEFLLNVPLWPSEEMIEQHGFAGVFIYGTNVRRVYFTFDSPTTLANTLAILLPLAVALALNARALLARLAWLLAALAMALCIVVTFSRGIWVAAALSLVVYAFWLARTSPAAGSTELAAVGFVRRNRRALLAVGGVLVLVALIWAAVWLAWRPWEEATLEGVVELGGEGYRTLPLRGAGQSLLATDPALGSAATQTWTIPDPLSGDPDTRSVLFEHPPQSGKAEIIYQVAVPESGALRFAIALSSEVWAPWMGDGVDFEVFVDDPATPEQGQAAFVRHINPKSNISDRRWRNFVVDLSPWAGRTVNLSLLTGQGKQGDWQFDWAGWAEPQIVQLEPGFFASAQTESAVLRHTGSIADWVQDESNRDRLAAWSQGLDAWREAPLWGTGLGSTGVAALRTQPDRATVTESQVLKALVELGPLGLLVLALLWVQIARVGYRTALATSRAGAAARLSSPKSARSRLVLLLGVLASLLVVFVEGWVYQNLEVKQVNAYFWALTGVLAFLAATQDVGTEDAGTRG